MSATSEEAYERIEALFDANQDARLPEELRDEIRAATDEGDIEILENAVSNGGGRR